MLVYLWGNAAFDLLTLCMVLGVTHLPIGCCLGAWGLSLIGRLSEAWAAMDLLTFRSMVVTDRDESRADWLIFENKNRKLSLIN